MRKTKIIHVCLALFFTAFVLPQTVQASDIPVQFFSGMEGLSFETPLPQKSTSNPITKEITSLKVEIATASSLPQESTSSGMITLQTTKIPEKVIITKTASPTPTETPRPTPLPTRKPTPIPNATQTPVPVETATPVPVSQNYTLSNGGLDPEKIFNLVNAHRQSINLPPVEKNDQVCAVASSRAPELPNEFATGNLHAGIRARNLPYWNHENIISASSEENAVNWWLSDTIHREGIEGNYKYSCVACYGNACVQEFTNLVNK